jgi:hypothetical protein
MPCLSSGCAAVRPGCVLRNGEPGRTVRRPSQDGHHIGDRPVRDPLLAAVDPIPDHGAVLFDTDGGRLHRPEVAAGVGLCRPVCEHDALLGDRPQPAVLLLLRGSHEDRITAEERGEDGGCQADVVARHHLADAIGVERTAVHPAVLGGHEDQLDAELFGVRHRTDDVLGTDVFVIEFELTLRRECVPDELVERVEHHRQVRSVEAGTSDVSGGVVHRVRHVRGPLFVVPVSTVRTGANGRKRQRSSTCSGRGLPTAQQRRSAVRRRPGRHAGAGGPCSSQLGRYVVLELRQFRVGPDVRGRITLEHVLHGAHDAGRDGHGQEGTDDPEQDGTGRERRPGSATGAAGWPCPR